jgi:lysophospholipase L1-like esterase
MNSTDAAYCFIGLSLGNEGIRGIRKEEVYNQYSTNMRQLIDMMTADGIQVILGGNYANDYYDAVEYAYIRRINIETDQWEVPNVNFNGASEDLTGKWAPGFVNDPLHPNNEGHTEMYYSIVPTVYEALKQGRPKGARQDGSDFFPIERFIGDGDRSPPPLLPPSFLNSSLSA